MGTASNYLRDLGKSRLDSAELDRFLTHVAAESEKVDRQLAVDHLLRVADLTPDQVLLLSASGPVRGAVGLQHSVKRYATAKQYEAAQQAAANESEWKKLVLILTTC